MASSSLPRKAGGAVVTLPWSRLLQARSFTAFATPLLGPSSASGSDFVRSPSPLDLPIPHARDVQPQVPRTFPFGGAMELMAVPKKKVSRYKKGLRNGPKALKPVSVIVRCLACGRVKLPHYYCCSGNRGNSGKSESTS